MTNKNDIQDLINAAKKGTKNSYSPYSNFKVGAAFEDQNGNIFYGCNVENLAFPSGICAEQTAIAKGVSETGPSLKIKTLVVYTPTQSVTTPCGGCRQVINEFGTSETVIISVCDSEDYMEVKLQELLPQSTRIDFDKNE